MKIEGRIKRVAIGQGIFGNAGKLTVRCMGMFGAGDFKFRVKDSIANRRAYYLGRDITIEVKLGK